MVDHLHVVDVILPEPRKVKVKLITIAIFLLAGAVVMGCSRDPYCQAIESGRATQSLVMQFDRLFPNAWHTICSYNGVLASPMWRSQAGIHGRYILHMECRVTLDEERRKVVGFGEPRFQLVEVTRIDELPTGQTYISYSGVQLQFSEAEWVKLVASDGCLEVLGVQVVKDKPVRGFEEHWKAG